MPKYKTLNDTPHKEELIAKLNHSLANLTNMKHQLKHAHWNVRGIHFYQVHLLFDEIAEELEEFIDKVAEKITSLGGVAYGLLEDTLEETCLPKYPKEAITDKEHLEALIVSMGKLANETRSFIHVCGEELESETTADLFTEIGRLLDKRLWFLEAHVKL